MSIKSLSIEAPLSKSLGFYQDDTYLGRELTIVILAITRNRSHLDSGCRSEDLQVGSMHGNCLDCKFNFLRNDLNSCEDSYTLLFTMSDNPHQTYSMLLNGELVPQVDALDRVLQSIQLPGTRGSSRIVIASLKSLTKLDFHVSPIVPSKSFTSTLNKIKIANS